MTDPAPLANRLKNGILSIEQLTAGGPDEDAIPSLHRSLQTTLARMAPGNTLGSAVFRFQLTGGRALLFQGNEALPLDAGRVAKLLNSIGVELQAGESIDLDGELAASIIRPEMNLIDTNLRQAEVSLRGMKTGRDRDHSAVQTAETAKVRLRSRLTQLVSAIQAAQRDSAATLSAPPAAPIPVQSDSRIFPKKPDPGIPSDMTNASPPPEVLAKGLRKVLAAIEGSGFKAAAIGDTAHQSWGSKAAAQRVELLISSTEAQRETVLGAARGEGLQQAPGGGPLQLQFTDAKVGKTAPVTLLEAATPYLKQVLTRAQPGAVFQVQVRVATCEDLILLRAGSSAPGDRDSVIELLRGTAGRIDGAYLKKEAEANGVFDQLKAAWQQAKQQA
ncbi:MAG TPA: hypothetical protein VG457_14730 [Planctomycetota bacterium]|jgi:hypothetical protein|nr:hypothetical protein [Planctomycetota bacterium]